MNAEDINVKQQALKVGEAAIQEYKAHFHEIVVYDGLGTYWRRVVYQEILERLEVTNLEMDFVALKEEFLLELPATLCQEDDPTKETRLLHTMLLLRV